MDTIDETNFDAHLKIRVPARLKARLERIGAAKVKTLSEVCREACVEYAEKNKDANPTQADHKTEAA